MTNKTRNNYRITFKLKENEQREITLSRCYDESVVSEFKELVKQLTNRIRFGTGLSKRDWLRIESLPLGLRKKLIDNKLIEGTADEKIPTISQLIEQYKKTRTGIKEKSKTVENRFFSYLIEYFGGDKRIDLITPVEAGGIRNYLMMERKAGHGKLKVSSANRAVKAIKPIFNFAVDCNYLTKSPFAKVKGGDTTSTERQYYVTVSEIQSAINACGQDVELAGVLALARYAGLRIPSEIQDLRFSDFDPIGIFRVPISGKTGTRRVPLFDEVKPYLEAIKAASQPEQEFVFEKYRTCKNIGTLIKKKMQKAGLKTWEKFFVNLRSSCITDKERLGLPKSQMDSVFGNSEAIRLKHYIQPMQDDAYAALGKATAKQKTTSDFTILGGELGEKWEVSNLLPMLMDKCGFDEKERIELIRKYPLSGEFWVELNSMVTNFCAKEFWELPAESLFERNIDFMEKIDTLLKKIYASYQEVSGDTGNRT